MLKDGLAGVFKERAMTQVGPAQGSLILVVDDDEASRSLLEAVLTRRGYRVLLAGDAAGALATLALRHPPLVICDVRLSGTDGFGVTRLLRADAALAVPVILLTAFIAPGDIEQAQAAGAAALLLRSRSYEPLLAQIEATLNGQARVNAPRAG